MITEDMIYKWMGVMRRDVTPEIWKWLKKQAKKHGVHL